MILQERTGEVHLFPPDKCLLGGCVYLVVGHMGTWKTLATISRPDLVTPAQSSRFGGKGVWRWRETGVLLEGRSYRGAKGL